MVVRRVVRSDQSQQHVDVSLHLGLQRATETFDDARFDVFVFRAVPMYVVVSKHALKRRVYKFGTLVGLQHSRTAVIRCEYLSKHGRHFLAGFAAQWYRSGSLGKDFDAGQQIAIRVTDPYRL